MNSLESQTTRGSVSLTERTSAPARLVRQVLSTSLHTKLLIVFLAVALVPLVLLAVLNSQTAANTLEQTVGASIKALADTQAPVMGDLLDWQINRLQLFSQNPSLREAVQAANETYHDPATIRAEIDRLDKQWRAADAADNDADPLVHSRLVNSWADILRGYRDILPDNVEVFITDKYGAVVATTNRTSDYNQADEEWWMRAFNNGQGAIYVGQLDYDESSKTYASNIAVPVYGQDGTTVIGVLRTTLQLTTLMSTLELARLGKTGYAELYFPGDRKLVGKNEKPAPADRDLVAQLEAHKDSAYFVTSLGGVPSLVSQAQVVSTNPARAAAIVKLGWTIVIHQDRDESLVGVRTLTQNALLLSLTIAALVGLTAVIGAQWLSRPILQLTAAAREIASGNLHVQARQETGDEIGTLAGAFNSMIDRLQNLIGNLEQRVAERTAEISQANELLSRQANQLQASTQVSRAATTLVDPDQLIPRVVGLIRQQFGFYYVGLFLVDQDNCYAVLEAGMGAGSAHEAGRIMKERGHRLEIGGQSMVGWACATRKARIALDVGQEPVRFANPLLPETHSEMALPLLVGERVLGALDVQSTRVAAFDESDIAALQGMADQIAVALENARLFRQAQTAIQELENANRLLVREGWEGYQQRRMGIPRAEFRPSDTPGADALPEAILIPLELRGQPIGRLTVRRESEHPWSDEEVEMLRAIALQTALAADNARLVEQTQLALQETEGLFEATRTIAGLTQLTEICQSLANYANTLEQADRTIVTLVDADRRQILARVGAGNFEGELDMTYDEFDAGLGGQVLRSGEPILSLSADDSSESEETRERRKRHDIGALFIVPLGIKGQVVGTVSVVNRTHQRRFTQHNVDLAQALAGPAATALENVRLLEATQRRAERERLIRQITTRVRAATDIESVLETTASELAHTLGVPRAIVRLTMGDKDGFTEKGL